MKYYNFETMFISLATKLGDFLHDNHINFEISKAGQYYHFEILTDDNGANEINNFLDNNTIGVEGWSNVFNTFNIVTDFNNFSGCQIKNITVW